MKIIHLIAAARPNFMKIAPLYHELMKHAEFAPKIIHTGQHYDANMSDNFFQDLGLPLPDKNLKTGSGTHAQQTAIVMIEYEKYLYDNTPDLVVVVGDVNSTMACAITAKKLTLTVAHLEAGLRSFDRTMPEEINRLVTDSISDILWTPSQDADNNLIAEGVSSLSITRVGNIMIDSLVMMKDRIASCRAWNDYNLIPQQYGIITIHRPSNTDSKQQLANIIEKIKIISTKCPVAFPLHPRTRAKAKEFGLLTDLTTIPSLSILPPLSYVEFISLLQNAKFAITDSGGLQEECTFMNIPCLTLRKNTERPITCTQGTNKLINILSLEDELSVIMNGHWQQTSIPEMWDGKTATRIIKDITNRL